MLNKSEKSYFKPKLFYIISISCSYTFSWKLKIFNHYLINDITKTLIYSNGFAQSIISNFEQSRNHVRGGVWGADNGTQPKNLLPRYHKKLIHMESLNCIKVIFRFISYREKTVWWWKGSRFVTISVRRLSSSWDPLLRTQSPSNNHQFRKLWNLIGRGPKVDAKQQKLVLWNCQYFKVWYSREEKSKNEWLHFELRQKELFCWYGSTCATN